MRTLNSRGGLWKVEVGWRGEVSATICCDYGYVMCGVTGVLEVQWWWPLGWAGSWVKHPHNLTYHPTWHTFVHTNKTQEKTRLVPSTSHLLILFITNICLVFIYSKPTSTPILGWGLAGVAAQWDWQLPPRKHPLHLLYIFTPQNIFSSNFLW